MRSATGLVFALSALGHCMSGPAFGQVFDLSAGASTLYQAEGASVAIHGANSETSVGAGLINHHLAVGASSTTRVRGGRLTTGQQQLSMEASTVLLGCPPQKVELLSFSPPASTPQPSTCNGGSP